ncbi:MAG: efflux transporter outer membrane subunit [Alphaproteobacteria bacterium]|nr:efflux transporter outer membrane subunit [Alphaproteobacteria bacterium]
MRISFLLTCSALTLSGCIAGSLNLPDFKGPGSWVSASGQEQRIAGANAVSLQNWWHRFNDPLLSVLIDKALEDSPDRKIAEARILEARGLRKATRASLFPQIGASATKGREDTVQSDADDYYDARFDASYELDIFGKNRKRFAASNATLENLEAKYQDVTLSLIAEVARTYTEMCAAEKQVRIAQDNLKTQEQTLSLVGQLYAAGESPQLDVERTKNLVNTTRASIPEFQRQSENARLRLSVLTGALPNDLAGIEFESKKIPGSDVVPVLMAPAKVLALRPDIRAAAANLRAKTNLSAATLTAIFPSFTLSGFYGVAENAFASSTGIWNVAVGAAVTVLSFGRLEGEIDAARAREMEAYESYRKVVLEAVVEVETALSDYAHINEQAFSLFKAYENAQEAFFLSQQLFKEGEISFLDVLHAQRTVNDAQSALTNAQAAKALALIRLYKSLGVGPT